MRPRTEIRPDPTPEEAAAVLAALEVLRRRERPARTVPEVGRWELSGRLGRVVPVGRALEASPWSYPRLEGEF